jgi:hypothetical protein
VASRNRGKQDHAGRHRAPKKREEKELQHSHLQDTGKRQEKKQVSRVEDSLGMTSCFFNLRISGGDLRKIT